MVFARVPERGTLVRIHGRRDTNHAETRDAFRRAGWYWVDLADLGGGIPDGLACSPAGRVVLVECKSVGGVFTHPEAAFCMAYPGAYFTVRTLDDVARILNDTS
jgi:hypothetical protein